MHRVKIANVLLEDSRHFHEAPCLYVRSTAFVAPGTDEDTWRLSAGACDFTTFFNALSVAKWREYTVAERFWLHLELRGAACTVQQTHAGRLDTQAFDVVGSRTQVPASDEWREVNLQLAIDATDVLVGFRIETAGALELRGSYYSAEVDKSLVRPVELAIATTTFRKEDYVQKNIALVQDKILSSNESAARHISMHVVDNGRTLDAAALSGGGITIHPNDNVGGAGGFARGMIEALRQDVPATHVLLMDDDVEVSPESILRTWNLLSIAREEWADAFVGGAMMTAQRPDLLWEDGGYMSSRGVCGILKLDEEDHDTPSRMTDVAAIVANETFTPNVRSYPHLSQRYSAWWYCCIPTSVIEREGLPLPLFVRYDDVEYSLRCKPRFMSMNGISIWHDDFSSRFNAAVEHYQTTRNSFIIRATSNAAPLSDFEGQMLERAMFELAKFNYTDAQFIVDGFEDFLKGPGFYASPGIAEQTYLAANRRREQLIPYEELREQTLREFEIDLDQYDVNDLKRDYPLGLTKHGSPFRVSRMQAFKKSINGQLFGTLKQYVGPVAVIIANTDWLVGRVYGVDAVVAIDIPSKRGTIRHRDNDRCKAIWNRLKDDLAEYRANKADIDTLYMESKPIVTSVAYWKKYLGL